MKSSLKCTTVSYLEWTLYFINIIIITSFSVFLQFYSPYEKIRTRQKNPDIRNLQCILHTEPRVSSLTYDKVCFVAQTQIDVTSHVQTRLSEEERFANVSMYYSEPRHTRWVCEKSNVDAGEKYWQNGIQFRGWNIIFIPWRRSYHSYQVWENMSVQPIGIIIIILKRLNWQKVA